MASRGLAWEFREQVHKVPKLKIWDKVCKSGLESLEFKAAGQAGYDDRRGRYHEDSRCAGFAD